MAQDEVTPAVEQKAQVTLAEAEAKLRAAKTATERVEAQKLVRAAEEQTKKAEQAAAVTAQVASAPVQVPPVESAPAPAPKAESAPAQAPQVKKHVVQKGESLSLIAKHYYGDIHKWKQLYEANKAVIGDNPDLIKPGQELVIPD